MDFDPKFLSHISAPRPETGMKLCHSVALTSVPHWQNFSQIEQGGGEIIGWEVETSGPFSGQTVGPFGLKKVHIEGAPRPNRAPQIQVPGGKGKNLRGG